MKRSPFPLSAKRYLQHVDEGGADLDKVLFDFIGEGLHWISPDPGISTTLLRVRIKPL